MHASGKYLDRQAAGTQRPNDVVLRLRRNIQGMNPRDRLCHRRGQRAAVALSQAFFSLEERGCSTGLWRGLLPGLRRHVLLSDADKQNLRSKCTIPFNKHGQGHRLYVHAFLFFLEPFGSLHCVISITAKNEECPRVRRCTILFSV
jgi:hypothetical protein